MSLHLAVRLLRQRNAAQQRLERHAVRVGAPHHDPRAIKCGRRVVGPLHALAVGAVHVGVLAEQLKRSSTNLPKAVQLRVAALERSNAGKWIADLNGLNAADADAPGFDAHRETVEGKRIASHPGL